jgi:queuine tRNA-ribosyltransferase
MNNFTLLKTCGKARVGELKTNHGIVQTPVLCPVGTQASVKSLTPQDIDELGIEMILSNTYHLYLRPGISVIEKLGGLHKFMGLDGAILTDSGGYQIFSLSRLMNVSDEGVKFRSHIDGSEHTITPELTVKYQEILGSDIAMVLDQCIGHDESKEKVFSAMVRTHEWAKRCQESRTKPDQMLFAIIQGGQYREFRKQSVETLTAMGFEGYAIGGLSIGEPKNVTLDITEYTASLLPDDKPRYLMGVGAPEDIIECVGRGIDIFDCALPTRVARNGALYIKTGRIDILNARFREQAEPLEADCDCYTCRHFSAAYLHHLFRSRELLAYRLATIHNLAFMSNLVQSIRKSIRNDSFESFSRKILANYKPTDEKTRLSQKKKWLETRSKTDSSENS